MGSEIPPSCAKCADVRQAVRSEIDNGTMRAEPFIIARPAPKLGERLLPGVIAIADPNRIAVIMAGSGETISYGELERPTNRFAHLFRQQDLNRLDHFAV